MKIIYKRLFEKQLLNIVNYIAKDKPSASIKFANKLEENIFLIPDNPYKYNQSIYFKNKYIRDMVYVGYTIIYRIKPRSKVIEVLRIFNRNKPNEAF
jgi:plasmid stabilization system protein ParE